MRNNNKNLNNSYCDLEEKHRGKSFFESIYLKNDLNNSYQSTNNIIKRKYKHHFFEPTISDFKGKIFFEIKKIHKNIQKTNVKLTSLISIFFSKLIGCQKYKSTNQFFSILSSKKETKDDEENKCDLKKSKNKNKDKENTIQGDNMKLETISKELDFQIKQYNLSNKKSKTKLNKFNDKNSINNEEIENVIEPMEKEVKNIFLLNNENIYKENNNTDNSGIENQLNSIESNRSTNPINFNEIKNNLFCLNNKNKNFYSTKEDFKRNKTEYIDGKIIKNKLNINKRNIENKQNKNQLKIKINALEKPVLLMHFNDSDTNLNLSNKMKENSMKNNIISLAQNLSPKVEKTNLNLNNNNQESKNIKPRRKFSESKSGFENKYTNILKNNNEQVYSRKIKGFNFRNNIQNFNKRPNTSKFCQDSYNKIKGGSVRYTNKGNFLSQMEDSLENDYKY